MTTTTDPRVIYNCPDWCERTDHYRDEHGDGGTTPPIHYGPEFGPVWVASNGVTTHAGIALGNDDGILVEDAEELRRAAAGMLKAADWIEAHR